MVTPGSKQGGEGCKTKYGLIKDVKKLKNKGMYCGEDIGGISANQHLKDMRERGMSKASYGRWNRETLKKKI